jgi:hypothetical protein
MSHPSSCNAFGQPLQEGQASITSARYGEFPQVWLFGICLH